MRQREDDAEVSEVLDAVEAYCEDHVYAFSRVAGGHDVGGTAEELLDEAFRSLGLAWVDEPIAGWAEALCGGDAGDLAKLVGALYVVT